MKKFILAVLVVFLLCPKIQAHDSGGAIAAGAIGGMMLGTMITSAASDSRRKTRLEDKVDQTQREQDKEVGQLKRELDKRELETKLSEQHRYIEQQKLVEHQQVLDAQRERERTNSMMTILFVMMAIMFLIIVGLGIYIISRRKQ